MVVTKCAGRIAAALLCASLLIAPASARAAQTFLSFTSDPGDYVGKGEEVMFTAADGAFDVTPSFDNGVSLFFRTPDFSHYAFLDIAAAGGALLQPGSYPNAERFPSSTNPGLDFSFDSSGCNVVTGRFNVIELVRDADENIVRLAVDWEQHCEGLVPALYGQLRFNSDVPPSGKPVRVNLQNSLNAYGCVEASNPSGAQVTVDSLGTLDSQGGTALDFAWSTSTGRTGAGPTFSFPAPLTVDDVPPVLVTLTVTDRTTSTAKTVSREICVSDTMPPTIVINKPRPGDTVNDNIALDVTIKDAVDRTIDDYEVLVGRSFVGTLDPRTGRSRTNLFQGAKPDGTITTTILVRAHDASGNYAEKSVTVTYSKK
jgi:hypothetical protein